MPDLSLDKLLLFCFLVTPGVIAIQVYSLWCPRPERNWTNSLGEVISYSVINLMFWGFWAFRLIRMPFDQMCQAELALAILVICIAWPSIMARCWYYCRTNWLHKSVGIDHPIPTGWDFFIKNHRCFFVLFHFKTEKKMQVKLTKKDKKTTEISVQKMLGGYFGALSYSSTHPQAQDIYVEKVYRVNEHGAFDTDPIEGTMGAVVRLSECERVEFFQAMPGGEDDG